MESKLLHAARWAALHSPVILLVARRRSCIAFNGADSERFQRIGSRLVTVAFVSAGFRLAGDI